MTNTFQYLRHRPFFVISVLLALIAFLILAIAATKRYFRDKPLQLPEPIIVELFEHTGWLQKPTIHQPLKPARTDHS